MLRRAEMLFEPGQWSDFNKARVHFLLYYTWLFEAAVETTRTVYNVVPKFQYCCHLI